MKTEATPRSSFLKISSAALFAVFVSFMSVFGFAQSGSQFMDGDIIFQTSLSNQSKAIQAAAKSKYSHMGLIFEEKGKFYVFEASKTVRLTPLEEWIKRGEDEKYVVKRLKNADKILDAKTLTKLKNESEKFKGKSYDLIFEWSDERIYCSELVWKIYKRVVGLEVGKLQKLGDFDLNSAAVKAKLKERYGKNIPLNETVISPSSMFESGLLEIVKIN
ncbi:MAG: YiiX family permuted papain-like enzyme [Campylobacteraceae bacterium]|jgi:hypothetical protein|nr:YiiX family permuted papain-like enzyme [Campylobacteraceae bacterium]